jgi:ligand-binding sensor domain-containing protein/signal transduction histidine kinase/AraC-like DNA-binding protein/CheY-like chemotaxis protein
MFRFTISFVLSFFTFFLVGQEDIRFSHLTAKEGMSQNSVLCIHQDTFGFMWLGTRDGLNLYDGVGFKTFYHSFTDENTLSSSYINHIGEDSNGDLWISTTNGLNRYKRETEKFERFYIPGIEDESYMFFSFQDSYGTLWVGSSRGLFVFDWEANVLKPAELKSFAGSTSQMAAHYILQDHEGLILFATISAGIFIYDPVNSTLEHLSMNSEPALSSNSIQSIVEDSDHNIWIATDGGGVNIWNRNTHEISKINMESHAELSSNVVRSLLADSDQNIWIGSFNGLSVFNRETRKLRSVESNENNPYSLNNNAIRSLFQDNNNTVWVGTYFGGVNIYDPVNQRFKHHNYTPELDVPLDYNAISAIVEDPNLNLWIGTDRGGLNHYNYTTRRYSYYLPDDKISDAEPIFTIKSLLQQDEKTLWVGTHRRGLYRFDIPTGRFRRIPLPLSGESITSLTSSVINSMYGDSKGYMWLCTRSYGGLYKFDPASEKVIPFAMQKEIHQLLGNTHVRSLFQDNLGNVWIATRGKGIIVFNEENRFLDHFYHDPLKPGSLQSNHIYQIEQDRSGEIWVATDGAGIARFDRLSGSFDFSASGEGLLNNKVLGILVDDYDNLWFSTIKGISRYQKNDSLFKNYDYAAGLPISELAEGAYHKGKYSGKLYFGGVDGFIEINPQSFMDNDHIPPVIISGFNLFTQEIKPGDDSGIMQRSILHTQEIRLKYNQSIFTIDFVALNFTHPASNQYAYMLEGLENSWNYVGSQNFATYTLLNSGKYTFKVKAANNDGLWNEEPATIQITILPPPWRTLWAYIIYTLLIAIVIYFIRYFILKNEQYKNSTLINEMQRAKLQEINEAKIDFFTQVSYELRTPLTLIIAPVKELVKARGIKQEIREKIGLIRDNAQLLNQIADQILDFRKLETGKQKLRVSKQDWVSHIRNITSHFTSYSTYRNISFSFKSSKRNIFGMMDTTLVGKVLFNLISHAFKNTPDKGKIKVMLAEANMKEVPNRLTDKYQNYKRTGNPFPVEQDIIIITIEDNGIGYTKDEMENIFAKFYDMQGPNSARTGIGLYIVNNILELHKGCIEVSSEKHKGTVFCLVFPVAKENYLHSEIIDHPSISLMDAYKPMMPTTLEIHNQTTILDEDAPGILVIEDQPELSNYMNSILRSEYHIRSATAVNDAFSIMRSALPDIILCDINQKPAEVIKLCKRLKRIKVLESVPIVIISANQSEEFRIQSYEAGANAFILKPFTPDLLKVRIRSLLSDADKKSETIQGEVDLASRFISGADEKLLRNIDSIIRKNISDPRLSVESLSRMIGLSRTQFYRKIKELTGLTVVEYIRSKRLEEAAFLLRQDKLSIKEVVGLTGFGDRDYFRTHFKKKFGTTPSNYMERERNRKK